MRNIKLPQISNVSSFQFVFSPKKNQKGMTGMEPNTNCHPAKTVALLLQFLRFIQTVPSPKETAPSRVQAAPKYALGNFVKSCAIKKNNPNIPNPKPQSRFRVGISFNKIQANNIAQRGMV